MSDPCSFIIIGATGNLAVEKLLPALYALHTGNQLNKDIRFIAVARRDYDTRRWRQHLQELLQAAGDDTFETFAQRFDYVRGDYSQPRAYDSLYTWLAEHNLLDGTTLVFYLAIPPGDFSEVINHLDQAGFHGESTRHRIVVEKPFGTDIDSARQLNHHLHRHYSEENIYRIDHYLGKETVQNLLVFRFANTLIEPIWNHNYIDHVQITVAESHGIAGRAAYYDQSGALRDMLQNHMMQLLSVIAMEPPAILDADALRDEKVKVLRSIRPISRRSVNSCAFRAQYGPGNIDGQSVPGYQDESGVEPQSVTETYVAAKFYIDNWRWSGVPFYLRTGKRMEQQLSMISIRFRHPPRMLFRETPLENIEPNWIVLALQPHESMHIEIHSKQPGLGMNTRTSRLIASYKKEDEYSSDAYEALLLDVIEGDRSLFLRFDEVETAWRVVDPILRHWSQDAEFIQTYAAGSWGPEQAMRLFDSEEHRWRNQV